MKVAFEHAGRMLFQSSTAFKKLFVKFRHIGKNSKSFTAHVPRKTTSKLETLAKYNKFFKTMNRKYQAS